MKNFITVKGIVYTTDLGGIAVADPENGVKYFIPYPAAAVWSLLTGNHSRGTTIHMLASILDKSDEDASGFMNNCLNDWRIMKIIH